MSTLDKSGAGDEVVKPCKWFGLRLFCLPSGIGVEALRHRSQPGTTHVRCFINPDKDMRRSSGSVTGELKLRTVKLCVTSASVYPRRTSEAARPVSPFRAEGSGCRICVKPSGNSEQHFRARRCHGGRRQMVQPLRFRVGKCFGFSKSGGIEVSHGDYEPWVLESCQKKTVHCDCHP